MRLSSEVVEKICGMDHLSGKERTSKLGECDKIASEVAMVLSKIDRLEDEFKSKMQMLRQDLQEVRGRCRHEFTKYFPDASGNNDSFYECQVCGAEVGKK